jgi:phage N-6-adenine-methyltransferase
MNVEIVINPKFSNIIPALTSEEYKTLETSIINDGCRDAIVLWNSTIVDGHNRYEICTKHNIEFKTIQKVFQSEEQAKKWIILNQLGRRNINNYQRSLLALELENIHKTEALGRMRNGKKLDPTQKSAGGETRDRIAEIANVSHDTIDKVKKIEAKASDEIKQQLLSGEISINQAFKDLHKPFVANNSGEDEWYTPVHIADTARLFMGNFDLDPASSESANSIINATEIFTIEDDGLNKAWYGNVWLNPPYSQPTIELFAEKLIQELPNIQQACVLVNNATETKWCQKLLRKCNAVCFLEGRVRFVNGHGVASSTPLQGQLILYFGNNVESFLTHFNNLGICTPVQINVSIISEEARVIDESDESSKTI